MDEVHTPPTRILLVGDGPCFGLLVEAVTSTWPKSYLQWVTTGRDALDTVPVQHSQVVVMDVSLLDGGGFDLLGEIRGLPVPTEPLLVVFAQAPTAEQEDSMLSRGASVYEPWPTSHSAMLAVLVRTPRPGDQK